MYMRDSFNTNIIIWHLSVGLIALNTEVGQFTVGSSGYPKFIELISGLTTVT